MSRGAVKKAKNASPVELKVGRSRTGLGLFTLGPIEKGTHIVEYTGRTLAPGAEYKTRSKYLFRVSKKRVIDGASRSNLARYINHSCAPNCRAEGMSAGFPSGAPSSTQLEIVAISASVKDGSSLNFAIPTLRSICHGGIWRRTTFSLIDRAHGRASL